MNRLSHIASEIISVGRGARLPAGAFPYHPNSAHPNSAHAGLQTSLSKCGAIPGN
jgi:hypothetical protein